MEYRFATSSDVDAIFDLIQRVGKESSDIYQYSTDKSVYEGLIVNNPCVVCCDKGKVVGAFISDTKDDDTEGIYSLAKISDTSSAVMFKNYLVAPEYRGRKIGMTLGGMLWSHFVKDFDVAVATVHPYNIASVKSLLNLGFEVITLAHLYGGKPRYIMRKNLNDVKGAECLVFRG